MFDVILSVRASKLVLPDNNGNRLPYLSIYPPTIRSATLLIRYSFLSLGDHRLLSICFITTTSIRPSFKAFCICTLFSSRNRFITTNIVGTWFTTSDFITSTSSSDVLQHTTTSFSVSDSTHPKILSYVPHGARFEHTNKVFFLFRSSWFPIYWMARNMMC